MSEVKVMVFDTWRDAVRGVPLLDEKELLFAMNFEVVKYNRESIVLRMHQRYTKLRAQRERAEMAEGKILI